MQEEIVSANLSIEYLSGGTNATLAKTYWNDLMKDAKKKISGPQYELLLDLTIKGFIKDDLYIKIRNKEVVDKLKEFNFMNYFNTHFEDTVLKFVVN